MWYCAELRSNSQEAVSSKHLLLILALFTVPISGLSIDMYVPSLPAISQYFGVGKALVQLSLTFYMAGLGLMQLFAGGISDSFGRKKPYLMAMCFFIIATLLIPFTQTINQFLFLRFTQGVAVAAIVVPMRSVVSDLYSGEEYLKKSNYMFLAWSMGPIVAPLIGGYLQHYFGWQANFYLLAIYSMISLVLIGFYMPETSLHRHPFHLINNFKRYAGMLMNRDYSTSLIMNGLLYSFIILFASVGPFLVQTVLHYSAEKFGQMTLLTGLAWFLGGVTNRFMIHIPLRQKSLIAILAMLVISFVSVLLECILPMNIYLVFTPIILLLYVAGIVFPNNFALSMSLFPKMSASANALFGSLVFFGGSLVSIVSTSLKSTSEIPLGITYGVIICLCLGLRLLSK